MMMTIMGDVLALTLVFSSGAAPSSFSSENISSS